MQQGRDVDDDVGHAKSGDRGVARNPEISKEGVELLVGLPDVARELIGLDRFGVLQHRELTESRRTIGDGLGVVLGLAHNDSIRRPGLIRTGQDA